MATLRGFCIVLFPTFLSLCVAVISVFPFFASIRNEPVLKDLYYYSLDTTNVTTAITELANKELGNSSSSIASEVSSIISNLSSSLGSTISAEYRVSLWGYCGASSDGVVNNCTSPKAMYVFDPITILNSSLFSNSASGTESLSFLSSSISVTADQNTDFLTTYANAVKVTFITFVIGFILSWIIALSGFFAHHSRCGAFSLAFLATINAIVLMIAAAASTVLGRVITNGINSNLKQYGLTAKMDSKTYILAWFTGVIAIIACVCWYVASCCCITPRQKQAPEDSIPMMANYTVDPPPAYSSHSPFARFEKKV